LVSADLRDCAARLDAGQLTFASGDPGHKPSVPKPLNVLPHRANERQVSGGVFEALCGPTRPGADHRDWQL